MATQVFLPLGLLAWMAFYPAAGWLAWGVQLTSVAAMIGLFGGHLAWHAAKGRMLPEEAVVDIASPFPPGHYLIAHGGSTAMINGQLGKQLGTAPACACSKRTARESSPGWHAALAHYR